MNRRKTSPPRRKAKGKFHHGNLAEQLVIVATELVEEKGHTELTLRELARRLGVTEPAIYRHFAGRDALLTEVAMRGFVRWAQAITASMKGVSDPFEAILASGDCYVRFAMENPGWFRLQFSRAWNEGLGQQAGVQERLAANDTADTLLLKHLEAALSTEMKGKIADVYRLLWAAAHGLATFVVERTFQRVETDAERLAVTHDALALFTDLLRARARDAPVARKRRR